MKKFLLMSMLLGAMTLGAKAQTWSNGYYDDIEAGDDYSSFDFYEGSAWEVAPVNFYYTNSGAQIIFTKEQVADLAGKNITGMELKYYSEGAYIDGDVHLTITMTETNRSSFYRDSKNNNRYRCFDISEGTALFDDDVNFDTYSYDYMIAEPVELAFTNSFYYSGENNLLVTINATGVSSFTDGAFYVNFFYDSDMSGQALAWASDKESWNDVLESSNHLMPASGASTINAPMLQLSYTTGTPIEETWQSYVPAEDVDLDFAEGSLDAYIVSATASGKATLTRVSSAKAGTALLLKKSIIPSIQTTASATEASGNLLQVSDGSVKGDGTTIYALAKKNQGLGFYLVDSSVTIPNGKIYLQVTDASASDFVGFDMGATSGISNPSSSVNPHEDDATYTLTGIRVSHPTKGVYIRNGKKIVVK